MLGPAADHHFKATRWYHRLPCWNDGDDGVPPFCRSPWCPLDHRNKVTNDSVLMHKLGNVGFPYFDTHRRAYFGWATLVTLLAILSTVFGCLAFRDALVTRTYWAWAEVDGVEYYVGLRSVIVVNGTSTTASSFSGPDCEGPFCESCADSITGSTLGTLLACGTLVFALLGTMNRMKYKSDCPIQKLLGMVTDLGGCISLTLTLVNFVDLCYVPEEATEVWLGPGLMGYFFAAFSGACRAVLHWVTPLPGQGIGGCRFETPTLGHSWKENRARIVRYERVLLGDIERYEHELEERARVSMIHVAARLKSMVVRRHLKAHAHLSFLSKDAATPFNSAVSVVPAPTAAGTGDEVKERVSLL
jgi:hypothetical protein